MTKCGGRPRFGVKYLLYFLKLILNRWDSSKPEEYYAHVDRGRTLASNHCMADKSTSNFGCIRKPLLNIPIANVRVDELHLLLRITGWYLVKLNNKVK